MNASGDRLTDCPENSSENALNEWPAETGHEQHLWQALEYVNDAIVRAQLLYDQADDLNAKTADAAASEAKRVRQRLASAGRTVESQIGAEPNYVEMNEGFDAATEYYGDLRDINASLEEAWAAMNDVVGAAEAADTGWSRVGSTDSLTKAVFEARNNLWEVQARIEGLLLDEFGAAECEFDRPAEALDW